MTTHRHAAALRALRNTPAWRLLCADNAPVVFALLSSQLLGKDRKLPSSALVERIGRELTLLRAEGWEMPQSASAYLADWLAKGWLERGFSGGEEEYELTTGAIQAIRFVQGLAEQRAVATESRRSLVMQQLAELASDFRRVRDELRTLNRSLRGRIADDPGLNEADLPFVGELVEVRGDAAEWQGAIERVLHGFAQSLLVNERRYAAVARHVNLTYLGQRLVYFRVGDRVADSRSANRRSRLGALSLIDKLERKSTRFRPWLEAELSRRFDYACVDNLRAFQDFDRALTKQGQIKQSKSRQEKDDRHRIDDRRRWVLGFDNRDKLALYQRRGRELDTELPETIKEPIQQPTRGRIPSTAGTEADDATSQDSLSAITGEASSAAVTSTANDPIATA